MPYYCSSFLFFLHLYLLFLLLLFFLLSPFPSLSVLILFPLFPSLAHLPSFPSLSIWGSKKKILEWRHCLVMVQADIFLAIGGILKWKPSQKIIIKARSFLSKKSNINYINRRIIYSYYEIIHLVLWKKISINIL